MTQLPQLPAVNLAGVQVVLNNVDGGDDDGGGGGNDDDAAAPQPTKTDVFEVKPVRLAETEL